MGNQSSSSSTVTEVLNDVNEQLTSIMTKTVNSSSAYCSSTANLTVTLSGNITDCPLNFTNLATSNCNMQAAFGTSSSNNLATTLQQAIAQSSLANATSANEALSTGNSSSSTNENMSTYLTNIVNTQMTTDTSNYCLAQATASANGVINVPGNINCAGSTAAGLSFVNNAQANVAASCMTNALQTLVNSNSTYQSTSQSGTATASATSSGAAQVLGTLLSGIKGILSSVMGAYYAYICAGVVILCLVLFIIYKLLSGVNPSALVNGVVSAVGAASGNPQAAQAFQQGYAGAMPQPGDAYAGYPQPGYADAGYPQMAAVPVAG